jgi:hypothetical protein
MGQTDSRTPSPYDGALEELVKQRELIDQAVGLLEQLRGRPMIVAPPTLERRNGPKPHAGPERRRRQPAPENGEGKDILAAVKKAGGIIKPGALAAALDIAMNTLREHTAPLISSGQLIVTGTTLSRRYSLPGHTPKEAP